MARFRKGKKAYKHSDGMPLWSDGSPKKRKLQGRYYQFLKMKEWNQKRASLAPMAAMISASSAIQIAGVMSRPDHVATKAVKLLSITQEAAEAIKNVYASLPPKPTINEWKESQWSTPYTKKSRMIIENTVGTPKSWVEDAWGSVDFALIDPWKDPNQEPPKFEVPFQLYMNPIQIHLIQAPPNA